MNLYFYPLSLMPGPGPTESKWEPIYMAKGEEQKWTAAPPINEYTYYNNWFIVASVCVG